MSADSTAQAPTFTLDDYKAIHAQAHTLLNASRYAEAEQLLRQTLASGTGPHRAVEATGSCNPSAGTDRRIAQHS